MPSVTSSQKLHFLVEGLLETYHLLKSWVLRLRRLRSLLFAPVSVRLAGTVSGRITQIRKTQSKWSDQKSFHYLKVVSPELIFARAVIISECRHYLLFLFGENELVSVVEAVEADHTVHIIESEIHVHFYIVEIWAEMTLLNLHQIPSSIA